MMLGLWIEIILLKLSSNDSYIYCVVIVSDLLEVEGMSRMSMTTLLLNFALCSEPVNITLVIITV